MGKPIKKLALKGMMAKVTASGMKALDQRSAGYKALAEWRGQFLADLGGEASLSAQEKVLVDVALRTKLFIDHVDCFLMQQDSLVNKKRRSLYPMMAQRNSLVNTMVNILSQLGLKRREKSVQSLAEFLATRGVDDEGSTESTDDSRSDGEQEPVSEHVPENGDPPQE
jgi:hypothetical protein